MSDRQTNLTKAAHSCMACPLEVRGLYATAANMVITVQMVLQGQCDPERAARKLLELQEAVEKMRPIMEEHFRHVR